MCLRRPRYHPRGLFFCPDQCLIGKRTFKKARKLHLSFVRLIGAFAFILGAACYSAEMIHFFTFEEHLKR
jgi:hypothetical protein